MGRFLIRTVSTGVKFDLKAANGQGILTSGVYACEAACRRGMESVIKNAPLAQVEDHTQQPPGRCTNPKFELYQDKAGEFRFRLKARNGEIIGHSDGYASKAGCLAGIDSVKKSAVQAAAE